jgi:hypothetical protein
VISYAGRNRRTVNFLKTIYFDAPEWTPVGFWCLPATWMKYRESLEDIVLAHPRVFPGFKKGSVDLEFKDLDGTSYDLGRHTDCWGSIWNNLVRGMESQVEYEPLSDWAAFDDWKKRLPDAMKDGTFGPRDWAKVAQRMADAKARGDLAEGGGLPHGMFFMELYYLRGFENLLVDMAEDDSRLQELIGIIQRYNIAVIGRMLELGAEVMGLAEDLGMQTSLPVSPAMWRKFVKPAYEAMCGPCRDRGVPVTLHSDGHILEIIPDLIECGVRVLNPQFRANGLEGLQQVARGKVTLNQDIDRQLLPFATPSQIDEHIGQIIDGLYLKEGGLMLSIECAPDVPLDNIEAICRSVERLCNLPDPNDC